MAAELLKYVDDINHEVKKKIEAVEAGTSTEKYHVYHASDGVQSMWSKTSAECKEMPSLQQ